MRRLVSLLTSVLLISLWSSVSFADDRNKNIDKLSSFKSTGTAAGIVVPKEGKYMDNIKKNIIPKIKMPAGIKITLFFNWSHLNLFLSNKHRHIFYLHI